MQNIPPPHHHLCNTPPTSMERASAAMCIAVVLSAPGPMYPSCDGWTWPWKYGEQVNNSRCMDFTHTRGQKTWEHSYIYIYVLYIHIYVYSKNEWHWHQFFHGMRCFKGLSKSWVTMKSMDSGSVSIAGRWHINPHSNRYLRNFTNRSTQYILPSGWFLLLCKHFIGLIFKCQSTEFGCQTKALNQKKHVPYTACIHHGLIILNTSI